MSEKTILVIGGTGATGKHFLKHSIDAGFIVRAIVRNPEKVPEDLKSNPRLQIIKGSFTDSEVIEKSLSDKKVNFVVCMAGDAKQGPTFMTNFVKDFVPAMKKHGTTRFLYQAGAFSPKAGETVSYLVYFLRNTVGYLIGLTPQLHDNDAVIEYLAKTENFEWIVTRPGYLYEGPAKGNAVLSTAQPATLGMTFSDLALLNLKLVQDSATIYTCDFPNYN